MHTPLDKALGFRAKAAEFHSQAKQAQSTEHRMRLLELASHYLEPARDIEEREQERANVHRSPDPD